MSVKVLSLFSAAILIIFLIVTVIFLINKSPSSSSQITQTDLLNKGPDVQVGDEKNSFNANVKLTDVQKQKDTVFVTLSTASNPNIQYRVVLYDSKIYSNFFLEDPSVSSTADNLSPDPLVLTDSDSVYKEAKGLVGKEVQGLFPLNNSLAKKTALDCNNKFLKFIQAGKKFSLCNPFMPSVSIYAQGT